MKNVPKIIIGVTGYLGSGKSTALKFFEDLGYLSIDADKIVHELYEPGKEGWLKIKDFFGEEFLVKGNGKVNRTKLRKIVFNNPAKLKILEKLIHPIAFNEIKKIIEKSRADKVAIEAIKFDEKRLGVGVTHIVWIDVSISDAFKRCSKNRKITKEEHMNIVEYQDKPDKIDFIIKNDKNKTYLKNKVEEISKKILNDISN